MLEVQTGRNQGSGAGAAEHGALSRSGLRNLLARLQRDIRAHGEEQRFCTLWRQISPEVVELVDYFPEQIQRPGAAALGETAQCMPAWQIRKVLQAQLQ